MKLKRIFLRKANQAFFASGCLYGAFLYARVNYVLPFHFGPLEGDWLVLGYYVAEAALVGSFADWFAVTAVFEVPWIARLLPFLAAHTAILPRSREAFVKGCVRMLQEELLTKLTLLRMKKSFHAVEAITAYLAKAENRAQAKGWLLDYVEGLLRDIDTEALSRRAEAKIKTALGDMAAYKYLNDLLVNISEQRKDEQLCDWLLAKLAELARSEETRHYIHRKLEEQLQAKKEKSLWSRFTSWLGEKLDIVNVDDATDSICSALANTADRLQQDSEWRGWFIEQVRRLFYAVYSRREWQQLVSLLQSRAVQDIELAPALKQLMDNTIAMLCRSQSSAGSEVAVPTLLSRAIDEALTLIEDQLERGEAFRAELEKYLQHLITLLLLWVQSKLGQLIEKIMQAMTDARLSEVVRSKVDSDMQNIRLNGTFMGAFIGLVIYLLKCAL